MYLKTASIACFAVLLAACSTGSKTTDSSLTDTSSDGTTAGTGGSCTALQDGSWSTNGACFSMMMTTTLAFDATTCDFTLTGWSMDMGNPNPTGGTVSGDTVTLQGTSWSDCTGTISKGGKAIDGTCASSSCAWGLTQ